MFCTNCGAQALNNDQFCPSCGTRLKFSGGSSAQNTQTPPGSGYTPHTVTIERPSAKKLAKKSNGAGIIVALMIVVVLAMVIFAAMGGYLGFDPAELSSCAGCEGIAPAVTDILNLSDSDTPEAAAESSSSDITEVNGDIQSPETTTAAADATTATTTATTTTTTATTTTTTTTKPTTTTTTVDAKKQEAEEIRALLISRKWKTTIEGYNATIEFKKDGTAKITVKVLFISKTIEASYSVNDKCHAVIQGEYNGQMYGISGYISKVSNTQLLVERDKNMGQVVLKAA